ncbi:peptidase [Loktanella sp. 3ANDIMAR09]|uniref:NlpC/P60 family protein n=1 Tax=Loktanella sp. 3ANDIMAR09 TaxID=1225657 RepID=UPI0006F784F3|nr:NlpC/P60 family protein [Loktanella sp. 3ANDIMAR09]KQI69658.1 peptidase [Loktanella sp. 3ANDIMAR09]
MSLAAEIARDWIGTPYVHQASVRGHGCDCLGLVRGVWRTMYGKEPETVPRYSPDWAEPQGDERLLQAAARHLIPADDVSIAAGQVLLFRMRDGAMAKHLGIVAQVGDCPTFVHAYSGHAVTESPLSAPWQRRIAARFAFNKG